MLQNDLRIDCGGEDFYTESHGRIISPGFPLENYRNDQSCLWKIWAPAGFGINLTFNLTNLADGEECSDKVELFRGFRASGNRFYRFILA